MVFATSVDGHIRAHAAESGALLWDFDRMREFDAVNGVKARGGSIDGQKINLQGSWKSGSRQYKATYSGSFVRRSAKLKGTQTWTDGGKTATRACAGAIKRPLKPFLPRDKK